MRWNSTTNAYGVPGQLAGDTNKKGAHASLSPFDMHNTLVAAGPDFRAHFVDTAPSGSHDVAPTILWIFGLASPKKMDGRILFEAMSSGKGELPMAKEEVLRASVQIPGGTWNQYLKTEIVGRNVYIDEGNGEARH